MKSTVALVTGGASGLGRATVERWAEPLLVVEVLVMEVLVVEVLVTGWQAGFLSLYSG